MKRLESYLNNAHYEKWLTMQFHGQELMDILDSMADDGLYPGEFIEYCQDCMAIDNGRTVWKMPTSAPPIEIEEEEIDHEFHFMEAPLSEDAEFNIEQ